MSCQPKAAPVVPRKPNPVGYTPKLPKLERVEAPMQRFVKKLRALDRTGTEITRHEWYGLAREYVKLKQELVRQRLAGATHLKRAVLPPPMMRPPPPPRVSAPACNTCHKPASAINKIGGGWLVCDDCAKRIHAAQTPVQQAREINDMLARSDIPECNPHVVPYCGCGRGFIHREGECEASIKAWNSGRPVDRVVRK